MPQDIALVEDPEFKKWVEVYAKARTRSLARPSRARVRRKAPAQRAADVTFLTLDTHFTNLSEK
jgi:hypothetical protein